MSAREGERRCDWLDCPARYDADDWARDGAGRGWVRIQGEFWTGLFACPDHAAIVAEHRPSAWYTGAGLRAACSCGARSGPIAPQSWHGAMAWWGPHAAGQTVVWVLVTGSRDWTDADRITEFLRAEEAAAYWTVPGPHRFRLVHGACPLRHIKTPDGIRVGSADVLTQNAALRLGWDVVQSQPGVYGFPADWDAHGPAAGPIRNQQMVDFVAAQDGPKTCLGFRRNGSSGTADCLDRARKAGIRPVEVSG